MSVVVPDGVRSLHVHTRSPDCLRYCWPGDDLDTCPWCLACPRTHAIILAREYVGYMPDVAARKKEGFFFELVRKSHARVCTPPQGPDISLSIQFILNCGGGVAGSCHGGSHSGVYQLIKQVCVCACLRVEPLQSRICEQLLVLVVS